MTTLAEISSKVKATCCLPDRVVQYVTPVEEYDPEWDEYLEKLKEGSGPAITFLHSELQKRAKIETGVKSVEYLRKLFKRTYLISKKVNESLTSEKSTIVLLRTLFGLAQGQWSLPSQIMEDMMGCLISAIRNITSSVLAQYLFKHALVEMKNADRSDSLSSRWTEIFIRFVAVLGERGEIPHESDIIDGKQMKKNVVEEICRMDWSRPVFQSYLTVLEGIVGIDGSEVDSILEKFSSTLRTMPPTVVHSCIEQIVTITGSLRPARLLQTYDKFFIYLQEKEEAEEKRANNDTSAKQAKKGKRNVIQGVKLGIVACNFVDASKNCDPIVKEIVKRVKGAIFDHTLVMTPFMLSVILAFTSVDYLRGPITEPLKIAILKNFHELNLCDVSLWYKTTIGDIQDDIMECFKYVVKNGTKAMEYMSDGLKELGISLLSSGSYQWKYPLTFTRCKELGTFLITTVVTQDKDQLGPLLKDLLKPKSPAHIDCLALCLTICCRTLINRNFQGRISELLHHLPTMSVESASAIMKSLLPSLQMAPTLLDDLMIVLRKSFWKTVDQGRICIEIICVILSNTQIVGSSQFVPEAVDDDLIMSQLTQTAARNSTSADFSPLCREVLNFGKRFFLLDHKVREQLYLGLHRVARRNPIVNDVISGQLHSHMGQFWNDDTSDCRINYRALFEFKPNSEICKAILKDQLGFLVQCIGFVHNKTTIGRGQFLDSLSDTTFFTNCKELLAKLINFAGSIETNIIEIVTSSIIGESGILTDDIIRFVRDNICIQTMQMMEALMEFLALVSEWPQAKQKVAKIFRNYTAFGKYMKESAHAKKGKGGGGKGKGKGKTAAAKKKGNTTKVATQVDDSAIVASGSDTGTAAVATASPALRKPAPTLKPPRHVHIINLDSVCLMLRELYGPKDKADHLNSVWGDDDFEMMLLDTVKDKVARLKGKESIRERQRAPVDTLNSLTYLIETIWQHVAANERSWTDNLNNDSDDEVIPSEGPEVFEARLEVVANVMDYFYNEGLNIRVKYFNKYMQGTPRDDEEFCGAMFEEWLKILSMATSVHDGLRSKANIFLFSILHSVCKSIDVISVLEKVHNWCWTHFKTNTSDQEASPQLLDVGVSTFLTCNVKCHEYSSETKGNALKLAKAVPLTLGNMDSDADPTTPARSLFSWFVTTETSPTLLMCLATYAEKQISILNTVLGRLKAHRLYLGNDRSVEIRDKSFEMIQCLRRIIRELVVSKFDAGPCVAVMLKLVASYYSVLSSFAEHLIDVNRYVSHSAHIRGFKTIVTDLGQDMKPKIETMIEYVERVQRSKIETATAGKKSTRLPAYLRAQLSRDTKLVPNLVYHVERFDQFVIALSKKVKIDMLVGMKLSTARDFRIEARTFKAAFASPEDQDETAGDTTRPGTSASMVRKSGKSGATLSRKRK